ncbi:hypothetical protein HXX76_007968 [Chlamydomonas incerta]|uniref:SET domain-containing protein n=1 Tax=Chlamydomonas incerta TaxID=51695 RepID=A0A835SW88_CHLIN|nr:hypothetical protein HXX76_007968 [Chlamydomonas incerta]|eukprot:KAG2434243.1 hypothetical protein HXX76_007968 [Chlamydomonas incerta]
MAGMVGTSGEGAGPSQAAGPGLHGHRATDISDEGDTFAGPGQAGVTGELLEAALCRSGPAASSLTTLPKPLHGESGADSSSALGRTHGVLGSPILKEEGMQQQEADQLSGGVAAGGPGLGTEDADAGNAEALADDWVKQEAEVGVDADLAGGAAAVPPASDEEAVVDDADPEADPVPLPHSGLSPVVDADDPDDDADAIHACGDDSAHRLRYLGAGAYRLPLGALPLFPPEKVAMAAVEPTVISLWYQAAGEPDTAPLRQHQAALRIYTYEHRKTVHITRMSGLAGRVEGVVTPHVGSTLGLWGLDDGRVMVGAVDVGLEAQDAAGLAGGAGAGHGGAVLGRGRHSHTLAGRLGLPPSGARRGVPGGRDRGMYEYGAGGNSQQRAGGAGTGRSSTDGSAGGSAGGGISSAGGSARWTPQALEHGGRRTMDGTSTEDMMGAIPPEWRVNARGPYRLTSFGGGTFGLPLSGLSVFPPAAVSAATAQPTTVTLWYMALSGGAATAALLGMEALQRYDAALRVYNYEHRRVAHLTRMKSLLDTIAGGAPATGGVLCLWRLADGRLLVTVAEALGGGAVASGVGAGGSKASAGVAAGAAISGATSRRAAPSKAKQARGSKAAPSPSEVGSLDDLPGAWEEELPDTATWALHAMAAAAAGAPPPIPVVAAAAAAPAPARSAPPRRGGGGGGRRRGRGPSYEEDDDEADEEQEAHTRAVADEEGSEAAGSEEADDNDDGPKGSAGPRDLWFNGTGIYLPRDTANLLPVTVRNTATEESAPLTLWFRAAADGATDADAQLRRFTRSRLRVSPSGSATISGSSEMVREVAGDMWDSSSKRLEMWLWRMEDGRCVVTQQHVPPPTQASGWHLPQTVQAQTLARRTQQQQQQPQPPPQVAAAATQAQVLSQALLLHQQQQQAQDQQQHLLLLQRHQQLQWAQQQLSRAGLGRPPLGPRGQPGLSGAAAAALGQQEPQDAWIGPQSGYVPPLGGLLRGLVAAGAGGGNTSLNLPAASITHLHGFLPHGSRLPPVQSGELRLCGLTFHPELAPGVRRAMAAWQASALARTRQEADAAVEQVEIPGAEPDPASGQGAATATAQLFHRYGLSAELISSQVAVLLGLSAERGWDAPLPAEGPMELSTQLVEPCQDVARGGAGLRAARRIGRSTVLGVVAGYVMPAAVAARFVSQGYRHVNGGVRSQLEAEVAEVGLGDVAPAWQVLAGAFRLPVPGLEGELQLATGGASSGHFNQPLELNMLGYGNLAALINDPRVEPRAWVEGNDVEDESGVAEMSANCAVLPVSVRGLLLPVLVTIRGVAPGEQLLRDYGAAWWRQLARPWEVLSVATEVAEARAGAVAAVAAGGLAGAHAAAPVSSYEEAVARQARLQQQLHMQLQAAAAAAAARGGDMYTLDLGRQPSTGKRQHPETGSRSVSPETQRRCV